MFSMIFEYCLLGADPEILFITGTSADASRLSEFLKFSCVPPIIRLLSGRLLVRVQSGEQKARSEASWMITRVAIYAERHGKGTQKAEQPQSSETRAGPCGLHAETSPAW